MLAVDAKSLLAPKKSLAVQLEDPCFFMVDFDFEERAVVFSRARPEWFHDKLRLSAYDLPLDSLISFPIDLVLDALPLTVSPNINYLFHLPFCGSSFLTRHLETEAVWLLRDPASLDAVFRKRRDCEYPAFIHQARHIALTCLNRRFADRSTVVRTAGYYPRMVEPLVESQTFRSGILLFSNPEHYLIQVLKSAERRRHVRLLMTSEICSVTEKMGQGLDTLPDSAVAALFWLHHIETIQRVANGRVRSLNCELLFADPERALSLVAGALDIPDLLVTTERARALQSTHAKTGEAFDVERQAGSLDALRSAYRSELRAAEEILERSNATAMLADLEAMSV
jgi:hypothetical protein